MNPQIRRLRTTLTSGFLFLASIGAFAAPAGFPAELTVPATVTARIDVQQESYAQREFELRDKTVIHRGKTWVTYAEMSGFDVEDRRFMGAIADALAKGGWETVHRNDERNPPIGTFRRKRDGRELWASVEGMPREFQLVVLELGVPGARLKLDTPSAGIANTADTDDFAFLRRFPGSELVATTRDDRPMLVSLEAEKEPAQVATGTVIKEYRNAKGTGKLEVLVVYRDALKAAGWTIVEMNDAITTGDPNFTAHFARTPLDLWAHVHTGDGYFLSVGDAGAEQAPSKLKAQLDATCKVAIYGVNFDFDKSTLRPDSEPALASILKLLTDDAALRLELGGHTDNVGASDYNTKLSEARVNTVRSWLVAKGVKPERLTTRGYADTQPVATNESAEGRAKNRRVELRKADCRK